jgi:resolvase-like protein/helix-turn-helix resolvase-like protein
MVRSTPSMPLGASGCSRNRWAAPARIARSLPPPWSSPAKVMCWSSPGSIVWRDPCALRSLHENIDTTSATGRLILHIFAALGQFEVELLRERTRTALAASRARGRIGGRPPSLDAIKVRAAKAMLASGTMTAAEVARQVGCSASTLYRHVPGGRTAIAESGVSAAA